MSKPSEDQTFNEEEKAQAAATLKVMLGTPHKPHKGMAGRSPPLKCRK